MSQFVRRHSKVAILKPLSLAISIGTGGPFGAEGPIITTLLCDPGVRYLLKIFNRDWLKGRRLNPDLPLESILDQTKR